MFVRCGAESHHGKGRIRSRSSSLSAVHREDLRYRTGRTHAAIHLDLKGNRLKRIVKRSNAQLSTGPKTPEGKKTLVLECLPTRPYRPDRHSHTRRPGSLPTALRRHPRSPRSGRRPRNRSRPSNRRGPLATQPRPRPRKCHLHLGLQEHSDPNAAHPEVDAAFAQGRTWIAQAKNLQLLTTYEQRIRRSVERTWPSLGHCKPGAKPPSSEPKQKPPARPTRRVRRQ